MGDAFVKAECYVRHFDPTTQEKKIFEPSCTGSGGTWVPLVK